MFPLFRTEVVGSLPPGREALRRDEDGAGSSVFAFAGASPETAAHVSGRGEGQGEGEGDGAIADGWIEVDRASFSLSLSLSLSLPPSLFDSQTRTEDGRLYYYHRDTRATRWDKPEKHIIEALENRLKENKELADRAIRASDAIPPHLHPKPLLSSFSHSLCIYISLSLPLSISFSLALTFSLSLTLTLSLSLSLSLSLFLSLLQSLTFFHSLSPSQDRKVASNREKELSLERERILEENRVRNALRTALNAVTALVTTSQAVIAESLRRWRLNGRGEEQSFVQLLRTLPMALPADLLEVIYQSASRGVFDSLLELPAAPPPPEVTFLLFLLCSADGMNGR
jgi:hypothetical protein